MGSTFTAGNLLVSRSVYTGNAATVPFPGTLPNGVAAVANGTYPNVFLNESVDGSFGVTSPIFLDQLTTSGTLVNSENVTQQVSSQLGKNLSTSFPSKSELALNLTPDGTGVTFASYLAAPNSLDVSNSNTPGHIDPTNPVTSVGPIQRSVTRIDSNGNVVDLTPINAYSGNNGRAAVLGNNGLYYTVGNAGNSGSGVTGAELSDLSSITGVQAIKPGDTTGNTTVVGISNGTVGSTTGNQNGFTITSLPGVTTADKTGKDDNFRGLTLNPFDNSLYVTKGSGGNGVDTVYKVTPTSGTLPTLGNASTASITILPGFPTALASGSPTFYPFGLWFANSTTLYVGDEGAPISGEKSASDLLPAANDANAGLEKWSLINGTWKLDYTLQNGLNLGQDYSASVAKGPNGEVYSAPTATSGLRNITGKVNGDGTVSIYGVTSTVSTETDQGADPNKVVAITDSVSAKTLPTSESFTTVESAKYGEVLRGVSFTPSSTPVPVVNPTTKPKASTAFQHVLVISIDGLHNSDLSVSNLQSSLTNIKRLQGEGITYSNAFTSAPSDSFPGELNYITGANPGTTGVFYDKSYSRTLYAPGTTAAQIAAGTVQPGTGVEFAENADASWNNGKGGTLDGGQGFDKTQLPVDSNGNPVYPNQYLKVNTIFDVASAAGLRTAWSDKHPAAYTILAGPSSDPTKFNFATGQVGSISDYSSLEINAAVAIDPTKKGPLSTSIGALVDQSTGTQFSNTNPNITSSFFNDATKGNATLFKAPPAGFNASQFTSVATTSTYDDYKVKQILNEIDGLDHTGTTAAGTPAIFGLNFQAVSVGEKNPGTLFNGGGIDSNGNARPDLVSAFSHTDASIGLILDELKKQGLDSSTLVVLTAKHGQNPVQDPTVGLSSTFNSADGTPGGDGSLTPVGALLAKNGIQIASENGGDTSSLLFLKNPKTDLAKALTILNAKNYASVDTSTDSLTKVAFATEEAAAQGTVLSGQGIINAGLGDPATNDRTPDIVVELNNGYFFGNATKKRAEHGGFTDADTHVALIAGSTGLASSLQGTTNSQTVSTTQIAPSTLQALGLDPNLLQGVKLDGTTALPGLSQVSLPSLGSANQALAGGLTDANGNLSLIFTNKTSNKALNEIGVFTVDDAKGTINGIAAGNTNAYIKAALSRSQELFGATPGNDVLQVDTKSAVRKLSVSQFANLGFYSINNSTSNQVLSDIAGNRTLSAPVSFNFTNASNFQVSNSNAANNSLQINFGSASNPDAVITVQAPTTQAQDIASSQAGDASPLNVLLDLRNVASAAQTFTTNAQAAYNDFVGYYRVNDTSGTVTLNGTTYTPGQAGYAQAATQLAVQDGLGLSTGAVTGSGFTRATSSASDTLGGSYYAPLLITNGTSQSFLAQNATDDPNVGNAANGKNPLAYFAYVNANPDKLDHIRGISGNKLAFEDLFGLGDRDFNDAILKVGSSTNPLPTAHATF